MEVQRISPPPPHYQYCQANPVDNSHHDTTNHSTDKDMTHGSLMPPPPPAYETLGHMETQLSTDASDIEPPPSYSSVVAERVVVEQDDCRSCSINYSDIEDV